MQITVNITDDDIAKGIRGSSSDCPNALALKRALPGRDVSSLCTRVFITGREYLLPPDVVGAIANYDRIGYLSPLSYTLTIDE